MDNCPTEEEMLRACTPEQIAMFEQQATLLQQSFGPAPADLCLPAWVWLQIAMAQQAGITDAMLLTRAIDESYQALLASQV